MGYTVGYEVWDTVWLTKGGPVGYVDSGQVVMLPCGGPVTTCSLYLRPHPAVNTFHTSSTYTGSSKEGAPYHVKVGKPCILLLPLLKAWCNPCCNLSDVTPLVVMPQLVIHDVSPDGNFPVGPPPGGNPLLVSPLEQSLL